MKENTHKFYTAPVHLDNRRFFFSAEAQTTFDAAPEDVKKTAMALLEMTCKHSMEELRMDVICQSLEDIFKRLEILEENGNRTS